MIRPDLVRASVVDIRPANSPIPPRVVIDANALYFTSYPSFDGLREVGGVVPSHTQRTAYPRWFDRAVAAKATIATHRITWFEALQTMEFAEFEALRLADPALGPDDFPSRHDRKAIRYRYANEIPVVRKRLVTYLTPVMKHVEFLPGIGLEGSNIELAYAEWQGSTADLADAGLVASAKRVGWKNILTDDQDFLTFSEVTIYTANSTAILAAAAAGKLVPPPVQDGLTPPS